MDDGSGKAVLFRIRGVSRIFRMGEVEVAALAEVELDIASGEVVVVLGPSGSGKSTLLNLIGGIDRPTGGHLHFGSTDLTDLSDSELTDYRREKVGFVFQFFNLVPTLTAYENVLSACELVDEPLDAGEALAMVGLSERADHFPSQLSGGEQQRVAIARALAKRPQVLLAEEPTGSLDLEMSRQVLGVLQRLNREQGLTILLITHNSAITGIADRSVRLASGRVAEVKANESPLPAAKVSW